MRPLLLLTCGVLALGGCHRAEPPQQDNAAKQEDKGPDPLKPRAEPGELPPVKGPARFIGKWSEHLENCTAGAWIFSAHELDAPASLSCRFKKVAEVPGGYDIAATCIKGDSTGPDKLHLRFAESAKAMLVRIDSQKDNPFTKQDEGETGLVYCADTD